MDADFLDKNTPDDNRRIYKLAKNLFFECEKLTGQIDELENEIREVKTHEVQSDADQVLVNNMKAEVIELKRIRKIMNRFISRYLLHDPDYVQLDFLEVLMIMSSFNNRDKVRWMVGGEQ